MAFSLETDGSTQRMNQEVEAFIRTHVDYAQKNWASLMPILELAINNSDSSSTGEEIGGEEIVTCSLCKNACYLRRFVSVLVSAVLVAFPLVNLISL
jgi:hypothetical protein